MTFRKQDLHILKPVWLMATGMAAMIVSRPVTIVVRMIGEGKI